MMKIPAGAIFVENGQLKVQCETYVIEAPWAVPGVRAGEIIRWNITAMEAAAVRGELGPPETLPLALCGPEDWSKGNLHEDRVQRILADPMQLNKPVISIEAPAPHTDMLLCTCDGQHRIVARRRRGLASVDTYVVPWLKQFEFRIEP